MSRRLRISAALLALSSVISTPAFAGDLMFTASFDESPEGPFNDYEAARFLTQATFGPTIPEIRRLRAMGYNAWLNEQFALPFTTHRPYLDFIASLPEDLGPGPTPDSRYAGENDPSNDKRHMAFFERGMHAPDQLRQRLAFALSEIFVTSDQGGGLGGEPYALANYYDLLGQQGLGTYRNLLEQVTLSPVMGRYLSMLGNRKPDPSINLRPDENYAREIMQLFSVGLVQLNMDGTPVDGDAVTPGVQQVSAYNQDTIRGFAHVFTGWSFNGCDVKDFQYCGPGEDGARWFLPMTAPEGPWYDGVYRVWHAYPENKQLLQYTGAVPAAGMLLGTPAPTAPHGNPTPASNLTTALNNIANHPNVGPFLSKLLIQRFVTSNPEPDYVSRVASVFNNNGSGVRGDLRAVVRAILMDPDARAKPVSGSHQGKLREPLIRLLQFSRAFNATDPVGRYNDWYLRWPDGMIPQAALHSPTVFNFFLPDYAPPGEISAAGLLAPEFQVQTDGYVTNLNDLFNYLSRSLTGSPYVNTSDYVTDRYMELQVEPERALRSNANLDRLLERLDVLLMSGSMSTHMRTTLRNYLLTVSENGDNGYRRVKDALWMIFAAPEYVVEK